MRFDVVDGRLHLFHLVLVLVHIGQVQAQEQAHIRKFAVRAVLDLHGQLVRKRKRRVVRLQVEERMLLENHVQESRHVPFHILHVRNQVVIDILVPAAEKVAENFFFRLREIAFFVGNDSLLEIGREKSEPFHHRLVHCLHKMAFHRFHQIVPVIVRIVHVQKFLGTTRVFDRRLVKQVLRLRLIAKQHVASAQQH